MVGTCVLLEQLLIDHVIDIDKGLLCCNKGIFINESNIGYLIFRDGISFWEQEIITRIPREAIPMSNKKLLIGNP